MSASTANLFINGEWKTALEGGTRQILNPANNQAIATVAEGSVPDAELAMGAARNAFDEGPWPRMRAAERASYLFKLADAIEAGAEELATLETRNNGKPLREAKCDVADAASCFRYYAGLITKPQGQTFEVPDPNITTMVVREPIGVCGQVIPWNYPLLMAAWKLAPGLAAGNCCILKPAEATPLTAIKLFELIARVGFPPGSAQLILGPGPTVGHALAASALVDKIAFTGGTATGRKILEAAAGNLKKTTLELGGKSPNIIFADADFEVALEFAMFGIYAGQGEVCSAGSRLLLQRSLADRFLPRLAQGSDKIIVGDGLEPATEMGPLITRSHLERVLGYIEVGKTEGAEVICGGQRLTDPRLRDGNFLAPTVFVKTHPRMRIVREEIFGPVLSVQLFEDEAEAVRLANDTIYGLAGGVFTSDVAKGMRVLQKLRAGITWLNTYHPTFNEAPWGGYKQSGSGRELGTYGLEAYLETKQININLNPQRLGWFSRL
ncbi:MAG TPA: aldehyde dehydrogenase family protein [Candidatus Binatia bacterium]|nr:aldehyde dehydrogenase family protein [Candidatus Binatia bacterium]